MSNRSTTASMPEPKNPAAGSSELPADLVQRLDALHARLGTIDHYTLLGIPRSATRAQVRQAFLVIAPQFHPDKYFGKSIGAHAAKMQRVFAQLSIAHDTLVNDERRAEYTRALPPPLPPMPGAPASAAAPVSAGARAPSSPGSDQAKERSPSITGEFASGVARAVTPATPMSPEAARARQQAFASRLAGQVGGRMRPGTPVAAFQPGVTPSADGSGPRRSSSTTLPAVDSKAAVDSLRRRYEESVAQARGKQTKQALDSVKAAEAAATKGDFETATKFYRAATEHSSDPNLRVALAQSETKAKEQLLASSLTRAKEAEQKQDYNDAGTNWARAFDVTPSAETAHRTSLCFRRAGTDLRRAAKYGEEAVKLDPNKASYRINLALVYADLGLTLRARGEVDRAHALEPQNPQLKDAIARVRAMK